jgi:hypothetical protein
MNLSSFAVTPEYAALVMAAQDRRASAYVMAPRRSLFAAVSDYTSNSRDMGELNQRLALVARLVMVR